MIDLSYEEMKSLDIGNSIKGEYIGDTKKLKGAVVKGRRNLKWEMKRNQQDL